MKKNPDLLAWFSKPEEAMNKKLHQNIDDNLVNEE